MLKYNSFDLLRFIIQHAKHLGLCMSLSDTLYTPYYDIKNVLFIQRELLFSGLHFSFTKWPLSFSLFCSRGFCFLCIFLQLLKLCLIECHKHYHTSPGQKPTHLKCSLSREILCTAHNEIYLTHITSELFKCLAFDISATLSNLI